MVSTARGCVLIGEWRILEFGFRYVYAPIMNGMSFIKWIEEEPYNFLFVCSVTEKCVDGSLCAHFKKKCFLMFSSLEK